MLDPSAKKRILRTPRMHLNADERAIQTKLLRKRKRREAALSVVIGIFVGVVGIVAISALLVALVFLSALLFKLGWNYGVDGLVTASGGDVREIDFATGVGAVVGLMFLRNVLSSIGRSETSGLSNLDTSKIRGALRRR